MPEQRKIAAILSSVDEAIEKTQAVIEQVQVVKRGLMQELLTKGMPGRHKRFKRTEVGEIPVEWEVVELGALGSFGGGRGFRPEDWSESGLPIIRIQNLNGSQNFNYYRGPVDPRWEVTEGQLLFAWAGSRGASFGPCIWPGPYGVLNQHIHKITPHIGIDKFFMYYCLRIITAKIEKKAHGFKQSLVHLKKSELTDCKVGLPPPEEQTAIVDCLHRVETRAKVELQRLDALQTLKKSLLSTLLTGEIRVPP